MKLTFLGTRGYIDPATDRHRRHTATLVSYRGRTLMIDCGADWRQEVWRVKPHALVITHAHPDHAFGLQDGAPCPVWATTESWQAMADWPIEERLRHTMAPRRREVIEGIGVEAFPVIHSRRAPAVGYRLDAGRVTVFYAPDVVWIEGRERAFDGVRCYIGDGASLDRSLVRKDKEGNLVGHTSVRTQLTWCRKEGVPEMIVTHCGEQIVGGDERKLGATLRQYAGERGVRACIAHDGMTRVLR
ncbi:MBL fold metallo-hydrolase [Marinobacter orientalis]|uniref:MBL fold metallo-hydrolase n=1 Tax=Marinobacter orientalis TaxID=1928859 RepID=A0A7Y0RDR8_9GAMM|nr:MBL fold metallo-hydrolase [Marinobacter orientalis]NMT64380.1 MBL fold metallo-hydrolase [Marinobacter orientalis]TGX50651.1 MBL fold metallo-hydrolase [Marinobacter orientalis]